MGNSRDIAEFEKAASGNWEFAAAAARLERSVLARRLHNGPLQDMAAAMLQLQVLADGAAAAHRPPLNQAVAVLIEQQRAIREMVEGMLDGAQADAGVPVALTLEALAMQWRQAGRKRTWTVTPRDAALPAADDLHFRLSLLEALRSPTPRDTVVIEVHVADAVDVTLSGAGAGPLHYSLPNGGSRT